ncbi:MAG: ubiquitin family protein, partial [Candidatus Heimdallarchaeota archaeon]|nr:ubiquitin family protein [Candidatus Heimdallarchaeota archaeon]
CCGKLQPHTITSKMVIIMSDFEDLDIDDIEEQEPKSAIKSKTPASSKTPGGSKKNVYLQSTVGPAQKQEKLTVSENAPLGDIKYTVSQIFNLPVDEFHLSHAGRTMDPDDTLSNYGVEDGDTILLIPVSTAGAI